MIQNKNTKNLPKYEIWKAQFESAISNDTDLSIQWLHIGIDVTVTNRKTNFDTNNIGLFKTKSKQFLAKAHNTGATYNPYKYNCDYKGYTGSYQDFVCKAYNLPTYDDVFNSNINIPKPQKVANKPFESIINSSKKEKELISFEVLANTSFSSSSLEYLSQKGNISEKHLKENNIFQIEKAIKKFDDNSSQYMKSDLLFGVNLENSGCYKIIDKNPKNKEYSVNWFPTLAYAKENGLLPQNYAYSLGIDTFVSTRDYAYLVGGEMDLLALKQHGFENVFILSSENASINDYVLEKLKNKGIKQVFVIYDTDFTGLQNSFKLHNTVQKGIKFKRIVLPKLENQLYRFNKDKKVYEYAYSDETFENVPTNEISEKPKHNDICDYISLYGFDFELYKTLAKRWNKVYIDKFIGDTLTNNPIVFEAINSQKTVLLNSDMNTGKSSSIVDLAKFFHFFLQKKIIFCTPRNILASAEANKHNKLLFIGDTFEESHFDLQMDSLNMHDILYCNADNLKRLVSILKLRNLDYHIVIDEIHLMPSDATINGREKVIRDIFEIIENEKTILLTGTPKKFYFDYVQFDFISRQSKIEIPTTITITDNKKEQLQAAINVFNEAKEKNENVLLVVNNLKTIRELQRKLKNENINSLIFASKGLEKEEENYFDGVKLGNEGKETIDKNGKITKDGFQFKDKEKQYVLGTGVVSTGFNFFTDKNIKIIYMNQQEGFNESMSKQIPKRIRNNNEFQVSYHIISSSLNSEKYSNRKSFDFDFEVQKAKLRCTTENSLLELAKETYQKDKIKFEYHNLCIFNEETQKFEVDFLAIQMTAEKHLIEFGSPLSHKNAKIMRFNSEIEESTIQSIKDTKEEHTINENEVANLYVNNFVNLCMTINEKTNEPSLRRNTKKVIENEVLNEENKVILNVSQFLIAEKILEKHFSLFNKIPNFERVCSVLIDTCKETNLPKLAKTSTFKKASINFQLEYLFTIKKPNNSQKREIEFLSERINEIEKMIIQPNHIDILVDRYNKDKDKDRQKSKFYIKTFIDFFFETKLVRIKEEGTGKTPRFFKGIRKRFE